MVEDIVAIAIGEVRYREPLAMMLLRALFEGNTVQDLVTETGIPEERIRMRLNAAEQFLAGMKRGPERPARRARQTWTGSVSALTGMAPF
jgi:hypothetical protein